MNRRRVNLDGLSEMNRLAQQEKEGRQTVGRPDLANPAETDESRKFVNVVDAMRTEQNLPEAQKVADWQAEAEKRVAQDYNAVRDRVLSAASSGDVLDAPDTIAAQMVAQTEAQAAIESNDPQAMRRAAELVEAYRITGTEAARSLAARRDRFLSPRQRYKQFLSEAFTMPSRYAEELVKKRKAKMKDQIEAGDMAGAAQTDKEINAIWKEEARKLAALKEKLRKRGRDLDELMTWLDAPDISNIEFADKIKSKLGGVVGKDGRIEGFFQGSKVPPWIEGMQKVIDKVLPTYDKTNPAKWVEGIQNEMAAVLPRYEGGDFKAWVEGLQKDLAGLHAYYEGKPVPAWVEGLQKDLDGMTNWHEGDPIPAWVEGIQKNLPGQDGYFEGTEAPAWAVGLQKDLHAIEETVAGESVRTSGEQLTLHARADVAAAIREASASKGTTWGRLQEYWINSILSGPKTQIVNVVGNAASGGWEYTVQRVAEAAVNEFADRAGMRESTRKPGGALTQEDIKKLGARFGEFPHLARAIVPGFQRAARNFIDSWQTSLPVMGEQIGAEKGNHEVGEHGAKIPGRIGEVVRTPTRILQAADEFFKSLYATMDSSAMAYRIARAEGLTGDAMAKRISGLVDDITSPAWHAGFDRAVDLTFQQELGPTGKAITNLRNKMPVGTFLLPFVKTPYNIFKTGLRKSPLGAANLALGLAREVMGKAETGEWGHVYDRQTLTREVAEQGLAWAALLALGASGGAGLGGDGDEPRITGTAEAGNDPAKRDLQQRTYPPQSIKIGDTWYSYARIEPMATGLSTLVDALNSYQRGKRGDDAAAVGTGALRKFAGQFRDKTFLKGLGDVIRMLESPDDKIPTWANSFAVSWIPNAIRQPMESFQGDINERRTWGTGSDFIGRMGRRLLEGAAPAVWPGTPKVDIWGREITKAGADGAGTDFLARLVSPIDSRKTMITTDPATRLDRLILNYQNQHPDQTFGGLAVPAPTFKLGRDDVSMTDAEYNRFLTLAGKKAVELLRNQELNVSRPGEREKVIVERVLEASRKWARMQVAQERTKKAG